jgi:dephospho-CoA kinase
VAETAGRLRVALGGGVGSGKSTLGAQLAALGAYRIDADQLARDVVEPGSPGLSAVVERFGADILDSAGRLDRPALAAVVFADDQARADLNAILHPRIAELSRQKMDAAPEDAVIVYEIPLLNEGRLKQDFDVVVVVETPMPLRLSRLAGRGMDEAAARARMAAQASDSTLRGLADEVIVNDGDAAALAQKAQSLWERLLDRRQRPTPPEQPAGRPRG